MRWKLFAVLQLIIFSSTAQNKTTITLVQDHPNEAVVDVQLAPIQMKEVQTERGRAVTIQLNEGNPILNTGYPDVPQVSFSLITPSLANAVVEMKDGHYTEYTNVLVAPSRGKIFRNQSPKTISYEFGDSYQNNEFYPAAKLYVGQPYTLRDFNGITVHINPVQYNPVTKVLRVYDAMQVHVNYGGAIAGTKPDVVNDAYDVIYRRHFLNYAANKTRYSPIKQQGTMLIVTPGMYLSTLEPFIVWKKQRGINVLVCNTDTLSGGINEAKLKQLATWYYQNKQIAYMLLVGDHTQVPAVTSPVNWVNASYGPCSDLANAYITNNDHYPEFIVGRFSAESIADVQTQVERTIAYEKYPNVSTNWLQYQMGIASDQGDADSDDGQMDYEHICDIMDSNKNQYVYVNNKGFFDGSQAMCNDDAGSPNPTMITSQFNSGVGLINYCGHGSSSNWTTSGFGSTDVANLTNAEKLPFIFSTACSNGYFMNFTCFAEALMRAQTSDGKPKGALATIMSSIVQDWNPPMEGQDEMNAVLRGARANNQRSTFGAIVASGFMAANDKYNTFADPDGGNAITDTWIIFGDPSVEVRTKHEGTITCSHTGYLQQNSTMFFVGCPVEGATITMYYEGELISTATVNSGVAVLYFNPVAVLDSITLTATKQNWLPYQAKVDVVNYPAGTQQLTQSGIAVYPNPTSDNLCVQLPDASWTNYHLYDLSGRELQTATLETLLTHIDVSTLPTGNYMLKLVGSSGAVNSLISIHR